MKSTSLPGVVLIVPKVFGDARGFLMETYKRSEFEAAGRPARGAGAGESLPLVTWNAARPALSARAQGAGQAGARDQVGEIFDVAVDIRADSPTYGKWFGATLSADNRKSLLIPPGFAHGFCVTSPEAEVIYKTTAGVRAGPRVRDRWDDPALGIDWPVTAPTLSERDKVWPPFSAR